ncbi:substrate-binding domain-containing protein [Paracraurococcus ruber]|uniref:Molybdate transport system substrate-binding protein n=1 Tax=Paracraurococcus ruber TaxID=77675 RepID=A0ABS1D687_9PROT|nr:substrate-binding domain-containing protein [Paracraurococcus ruber]MBK1662233.1 hypothetical protein [Paracraurococcus ruber]TDG14462.1 ABC transporter substrate-binding protein [Paracraurococcus ruber]
MRILGRRGLLSAALLLAPLHPGAAGAADLQVMSSGAFTGSYRLLAPIFEQQSGHRLHITYGASMGTAPEAMPNRLGRGEPADVLILVGAGLDPLVQRGLAVAGSGVDIAISRIGVAQRAGLPKPDISTVEGLRQAFLDAKSIGYSSSASGIYFTSDLVQRLGIADQVLPKARRITVERVAAVVARGEVELGLQQVSEITEVLQGPDGAKVVLLGPLPDAVQQVVTVTAALSAGAKEPAVARDFIRFLASPEAQAAIRRMGLEPVERR